MSLDPPTYVHGRRLCTSTYHQGQRWIPILFFYPSTWRDKQKTIPERLQAHCKTCQKKEARIRQGLKRRGEAYGPRQPSKLGLKSNKRGGYIITNEEERERYNAYQRERYRNMSLDQRELRRESQRIRAEALRRDAGIKPRNFKRRRKVAKSKGHMLDIKLFSEWIWGQCRYYTNKELALRIGVSERQIKRWKEMKDSDGKPIEKVPFTTVDAAFVALDQPEMFSILYPDVD